MKNSAQNDSDAVLKSRLIRSIGTHRTKRVLSPVEVAHALDYFASRDSLRAVCDQIGLDPSTAGRFLRLLQLPSSVQSTVDWGSSQTTISFSAASELAALPSLEDREVAGRLALQHHLTKDEIRQAVQVRRRFGSDVKEAIARIIARRPQVISLEVFIGAVPEAWRGSIARLSQAERDALLRHALKAVLPADAAVRLSPHNYTITSSAPLADDLAARLDDIVAEHIASVGDG